MSIVCGKRGGGGCGRQLVSGENLKFAIDTGGGVFVVVDPAHSEQAVHYNRVESRKNRNVPYKMHCLSCGASVGSTVRVGDLFLDALAWDKSSLVLHGRDKLPNKKWKEYLHILEGEFSRITFTSEGGSRGAWNSVATIYCQAASATHEVCCRLTATSPRAYQQELVSEALRGNTLVCLPTGSGKTLVAAGVIHAMKAANPEKVALFVVNTVPLVHQQETFLRHQLPREFVVEALTGNSELNERSRVEESLHEGRADVLVATCGKLFNMTCAPERSNFPLSDACVLVLDEAHHATGRSPYANLIRHYHGLAADKRPLLLALTASPVTGGVEGAGIVLESVRQMSEFLRTKVAYPIHHETDLRQHAITPRSECVTQHLSVHDTLMRDRLVTHVQGVARVLEQLSSDLAGISKISQENHWRLRGLVRKRRLSMGKKDSSPDAAAVSEHLLQVLSAIELLEVVGSEAALEPLKQLMNDVLNDVTPMDKIRNKHISCLIRQLLGFLRTSGLESNASSRWKVLLSILRDFIDKKSEGARAIVFVRMRRTARKLCALLSSVRDVQHRLNPQVFVGHSGRDGMGGWREQTKLLECFRRGLTSLLIATSVLEEGLDVPACKLVVRFNGEVSLRSLIQSRGRASRAADGKYITVCHTTQEEQSVMQTHQQEEFMLHAVKCLAATPRSASCSVPPACRLAPVTPKTTAESFQEKVVIPVGADGCAESDSEEEHFGPSGIDFSGDEQLWQDYYETEAEWGVDGAIAHAVPSLDEATVQSWFDECGRVCELGPLPSRKDYRGLNISGFLVRSTGDISDVGWDMIKNWRQSSMWLSVAIGQRTRARSRLAMLNLKAGHWCGQNSFLEQFSFDASEWNSSCPLVVDFMRRMASFEMKETRASCVSEYDSKINLEVTFNISWQLQDFVLIDLTSDSLPRVYFTIRQPPKLAQKIETLESVIIKRCTGLSSKITPETIGSSLVYSAAMKRNEVQEMLNLMAKLKKTVWFTRIDSTKASSSAGAPSGCLKQFTRHSGNPNTAYALSCVASASGFWEGRFGNLFATMLESSREEFSLPVIYGIADELQNDLFSPSAHVLKAANTSRRIEAFKNLDAEHCWVKRVILTPTRIVVCTPDLLQKNRVLRTYSPDMFLRVSIRDEDFSRLSTSNGENIQILIRRVRSVLQGTIQIGTFQYEFLTSTGSQIRDHSCWFVQCDKNGNRAQRIRDWMGNFSHIHVVATYISRLGQSFSTSTPTVTVDVSRSTMIPDIEENGYCFSDGVGTISQGLAHQVAQAMHCIDMPSAFQIRFGGVKGVVSVDPMMKGFCQLCVRPSMTKFKSTHRKLEILNVARPLKLYLNQQMIILLNNLGIRDDTFMDLLFRHLKNLMEMFINNELAYRMVGSIQCEIPWKHLKQAGLQLTQEPFFKSLLFALYRSQIRDVLEKARIPTNEDEGRVLLGVVDETGTLEYGEVFIRISKDIHDTLGECQVIQKVVAVAKAPCLHPGDPRVLNAVDQPALHHHRDVIVFPGKGPRPHPDEMSGSDLDGDLYHVIWDPDLVPDQDMYEPMDYTAPKKKEIKGQVNVNHMVSFICEYIEKDNLGLIDNTHKALADSEGVDSAFCVKLAELHSLAVDAPKTGQWAEVPAEIREKLIEQGYPDFMMRKGHKSYMSEKVLGKIYRESQKYRQAAEMAVNCGGCGTRDEFPLDETFLWEGFKEYLPGARKARKKYNTQLLSIMASFGVESEAEAISGCIDRIHLKFGRERVEVANIIEDLTKGLISSFVKLFHEGLDGEGHNAKLKKASAWYYATYHTKEATETFYCNKQSFKMLSFPWVVSEILCEVREKNAKEGIHPIIFDRFIWTSKTIMKHFSREKLGITNGMKDRGQVLSYLQDLLASIGHLRMFGSSAILTFESQSDLDIVLIPHSRSVFGKKEQVLLLRSIRKILKGNVAKPKLVSDAPVPFLEFAVKGFGASGQPGCHQVDITVDSGGLLKAKTVQSYILKDPWLLSVLRLVVKWGRNTGLMGHKRHALIPTNALIYLFINVCIERGLIMAIPRLPGGLPKQWTEFCKDQLESIEESRKMGKSLVEFFDVVREGKNMVKDFKIHKYLVPVLEKGRFDELGISEGWTLLVEQMHAAAHVLLLTGNAQALLDKSDVQRAFFISRNDACRILGAEKHFKQWLKSKTGAQVSIQLRSEGSRPGLIISASGTSGEVHRVDLAVRKLKKQGESLNHVGANLPYVGPKFVEGCTELIIEGVGNPDGSVVLQDYFGFRQPHHDNRGAHVIRVKTSRSCPSPTEDFEKFDRHLQDRLDTMRRIYYPSLHGEIDASVKFGRLYIVGAPPAFTEDPDGVTVKQIMEALEKNHRHGLIGNVLSDDRSSRSPWAPPKKESAVVDSFFPGVPLCCGEDVEDVVASMGFGEPETETVYKVVVGVANGRVKARYDSDLKLVDVSFGHLRWMHCNYRRAWIPGRMSEGEGGECDFRVEIRTRKIGDRNYALDLKGLEELLYRGPGWASSRAMPNIRRDMVPQVLLVKRCVETTYRYTASMDSKSALLRHVAIRVGDCTLHSRPLGTGQFTAIEEYVDVRIKPGLSQVPSRDCWKQLSHLLWDLSVKISDGVHHTYLN